MILQSLTVNSMSGVLLQVSATARCSCYTGKSTYLRQIGLLIIMAQSGCFVPAEYASFRLVRRLAIVTAAHHRLSIHDHLLTRLSNDDDIEKNLSTFANEMASCAMILGLASSKSLVLIDELGRATSPKEGVGIVHAIAEELIKLKVKVCVRCT